MNWNKYRQLRIKEAMDEKNISKIDLKLHLGLSYPTMLNRLKDPSTFKLSEFDKVCKLLSLDKKELLKDNR